MDEPQSIYLMNPNACNASPCSCQYIQFQQISFLLENGPIAYSQPVQFHLLIMDIQYFMNYVFHTSTDGIPAAGDVKPINKTAK